MSWTNQHESPLFDEKDVLSGKQYIAQFWSREQAAHACHCMNTHGKLVDALDSMCRAFEETEKDAAQQQAFEKARETLTEATLHKHGKLK